MADSIIFKDEDSDQDRMIRSDEEWLAYYDDLIFRIAQTGHAYSADGAIMYTQSSLPQLEKLKAKYEDRVLLWRGVSGRNSVS